ncbi:MAG: SpoIIE family protein phosphatase [Phycisphaerae bacterium]|jgi:serine phosphatase RsbU (regulator of sigma subunit)|nr:SpoIIE family protein phosphatase [Phycisphaerae bacterium]HRS29204.1 SpoIIE family protein phosphatase [Phycisphaerae bacterium]
MAALVIYGADGRQGVWQLSQKPLTLGRAENCDIVLRFDGEVSREHARVWLDETGTVLVADLGSKNGTSVDAGETFRNETRPAYRSIRIGGQEVTIRGALRPPASAETRVAFVADAPERLTQSHFFPSTKRLDLSEQRLSLLMGLGQSLSGAFERKQLLEQALDACCQALQFERCLIVLKTPRGEPESPVVRNVERDETGAFKVSRTLINRALLHGERAVVNNPAVDLVGNITDSLVRFPICSALSVPIMQRDEILGAIYGDRVTRAATYSTQDVDFLAAIAQQVGVGLANLRLLQDYVRLQKVDAELSAARKIQRDLLPAAPLAAGCVLIDGYNEPSSEVGGDYFDYFPLDDTHVGFVIADVTGHGLPAALLMANFQAAVHVALTPDTPLPEIAARINRLVCQNTAGSSFITAVLGKVDCRSGAMDYVNAGHPAPLLPGCANAGPDDRHNSLPLGIDPGEDFRVEKLNPAEHAGVVLFYTDGLTELNNPAGDMLGIEAVRDALQKLPAASTELALRAALALARHHRGHAKGSDDLTLLAIQVARP